MTYDVAVAYRIYPVVAKPAIPLPYGDDKLKLSEVCLKSFKESLGSLRVKIFAILDGCPPEYERIFRKYFKEEDLELIKLNRSGNQATFTMQLDLLLGQRIAPVVYFAEDDYLYLPETFAMMVQFLQSSEDVDFISPYDHLDCYRLALHDRPKCLRVYAGRHWRTAASTCLTFLTRKKTLEQTAEVFRSYSGRNFDASIWLSLTKGAPLRPDSLIKYLASESLSARVVVKAWIHCWKQILFGQKRMLWIPIPGLATHLDAQSLSPGTDWESFMAQHAREIALSGVRA